MARASVATSFARDIAYPNPLALTTNVPYTLPEATHVSMGVYDICGKEVTSLADGFQPRDVIDFCRRDGFQRRR